MTIDRIRELLGAEAEDLLAHTCQGIPKDQLHLPGPDFVDRVWRDSDRRPRVLRNLAAPLGHGRLARHRLPLDPPGRPGHRALGAASFAPNPIYFDPENIVELAIEGGCNAVASTLGVLGVGRAPVRPPDPVHRQAQPQRAADLPDRVRPDHVRARCSRPSTWARWRSAPPSTSAPRTCPRRDRRRSPRPSPRPTSWAWRRSCGATCATPAFKKDGVDYHVAADLTGQANHLGVTIEADIIKQKLPDEQRRLHRADRLRQDARPLVYDDADVGDHPIDLCR